ncbi:MAG: hypothetical protein ACKVTZ_01500 [Bacteroidia bacterium]
MLHLIFSFLLVYMGITHSDTQGNSFPTQKCGTRVKGTAKTDIRTWEMGFAPGTFNFDYKLGQIADKITIYDGEDTTGAIIYRSGEMKGEGILEDLVYEAESHKITVKIEGNTEQKTEWIYTVSCPKKGEIPEKTEPKPPVKKEEKTPPTATETPPIAEKPEPKPRTGLCFFVIDEQKKRVPTAEVALRLKDRDLVQYTDNTGAVCFDSLQGTDSVTLIIRKKGLKTATKFIKQRVKTLMRISDKAREIMIHVDPEPVEEVLEPCGKPASSGANVVDVRVWSMGKYRGAFDLHYHFFDIPDRMTIYEGRDTTYRKVFEIYGSTTKTLDVNKIKFNSRSGYITVKVVGNISKNTSWEYLIDCP